MDGALQSEAEERALVEQLVRQLLHRPAAGQP
jgi:hypothetical protein